MKKLIVALWLCGLPNASFAGAWTLPKGQLWLKNAVFYQSTTSRFCTGQDAQSPAFQEVGCTSSGHSAPFDPFIGGESTAWVIYTEATYGLTGWLDLGLQIPFYRLEFTNLANPERPRSNSFGDIRFFAKYRVLREPLAASLTVAAKSPTGKFNVDAEVVNVSEGQWDFDLFAEASKSFWPFPGYGSVGFGYRFRTDNENFEQTVADEMNITAEIGIDLLPRLMFKGAVDWLHGQRPRIKVTNVPLLERRELLTITPGVIYKLRDDWGVEAAVRVPVSGQDFPDGPQFMGAVSYQFSVR